MAAAVKALFLSFWVLAIGLAAVQLEVQDVQRGMRVRDLRREIEIREERVRRLELRFNSLLSPDVLERELPQVFREPPPKPAENPDSAQLRSAQSNRLNI